MAQQNLLAEVVRCDPCDGLTFDLCLIVDSFDGEEDLAKGLGFDDVMHKLHRQPLAVVDNMSLQRERNITITEHSHYFCPKSKANTGTS